MTLKAGKGDLVRMVMGAYLRLSGKGWRFPPVLPALEVGQGRGLGQFGGCGEGKEAQNLEEN